MAVTLLEIDRPVQDFETRFLVVYHTPHDDDTRVEQFSERPTDEDVLADVQEGEIFVALLEVSSDA